MTSKEFAEKNKGKYFAFMGYKVRVAGYCKENDHVIIVSVPPEVHHFGWHKEVMDEDDIIVTPSMDSKFLVC